MIKRIAITQENIQIKHLIHLLRTICNILKISACYLFGLNFYAFVWLFYFRDTVSCTSGWYWILHVYKAVLDFSALPSKGGLKARTTMPS